MPYGFNDDRSKVEVASAAQVAQILKSQSLTPGKDPELVDIRTAKDGTVYTTAGDAVRAMASSVYDLANENVNRVLEVIDDANEVLDSVESAVSRADVAVSTAATAVDNANLAVSAASSATNSATAAAARAEEAAENLEDFIAGGIPTMSATQKGAAKLGSGLSMDGEVLCADVTQAEFDALAETVSQIPRFSTQVVSELPDEGQEATIYLVPNGDQTGSDMYDEYMWQVNRFEHLGTGRVELTGYATQDSVDELSQLIASKADQSDLTALTQTVSGKASQNDLTSLQGTVALKADTSSVYTKAEIDDKFSALVDLDEEGY